jgi:hypothetical protein
MARACPQCRVLCIEEITDDVSDGECDICYKPTITRFCPISREHRVCYDCFFQIQTDDEIAADLIRTDAIAATRMMTEDDENASSDEEHPDDMIWNDLYDQYERRQAAENFANNGYDPTFGADIPELGDNWNSQRANEDIPQEAKPEDWLLQEGGEFPSVETIQAMIAATFGEVVH